MLTKPIPGWPGYHASDDGRIFSTWHRPAFGPRQIGGPMRELRAFDRKTIKGTSSPYLSVCLSRDGRSINRYVHELVMLAFRGPRPAPDVEICHENDDGHDNRLSNLRYDSHEANMQDRDRNGGTLRGEAWHAAREQSHAFEDLLEVK